MNHLFGTNFKELNAADGRVQTTKGIWIARCLDMEPFTLTLDIEGNDGCERGEDTTFEKQSALFSLFVSNIVLINMWCHDIGREQGACTGLLKMVFLVMMRLLKPRKRTLFFVIRDKSKAPIDVLTRQLNEMMDKIWNSTSRPKGQNKAKLSDFFEVKAFGLASYEQNEDLFKAQVGELKRLLSMDLVEQLAHHGQEFDGSEFALSTEQAWKVILDEKNLHLPNIKELVSTLGCKEVAEGVLNDLVVDDISCLSSSPFNESILFALYKLLVVVQALLLEQKALHLSPGSGKRLVQPLKTYLSRFDKETLHFVADIRSRKRQQLENDAWELVQPAYSKMLEHTYATILPIFKNGLEKSVKSGKGFAESVRQHKESCLVQFNGECADEIIFHAKADASNMREKLHNSMNEHVADLQRLKLNKLLLDHKREFTNEVAESLRSFFSVVGRDTWVEIRNLFKLEKMKSVQNLSINLSDFELAHEDREKMVRDLENYAGVYVVGKVTEESSNAKAHMLNRFSTVFLFDENSEVREWTFGTNIKKITRKALREALECLSAMAVMRLDETADNVKNSLHCLMDDRLATNSLNLVTWEGVPPKNTLIKPVDCKTLWVEFLIEVKVVIEYAKAERMKNMSAIRLIVDLATAAISVVATILGIVLGS